MSVVGDVTHDIEEIHEGGDALVSCRNMLRGTLTAPFLNRDLVRATVALSAGGSTLRPA